MGRTALPIPKTILSQSKKPQPSQAGFTLIEILIVLGIISLVMSIGLPAIQRVTYQQVNSTTRKFVGTVRTIRNDAILLNTVHRLAFDLDHRSWWVERQKQLLPIGEAEAQNLPQKKKKEGEEPEVGPTGNFEYAPKYSSKAIALPPGVAMAGVLKEQEGLRGEGVVYIHFFPNGFNDQAILYITRDGSTREEGYSVLVRATGGRVEIHNKLLKGFDVTK